MDSLVRRKVVEEEAIAFLVEFTKRWNKNLRDGRNSINYGFRVEVDPLVQLPTVGTKVPILWR
jgi:hypothetical protein